MSSIGRVLPRSAPSPVCDAKVDKGPLSVEKGTNAEALEFELPGQVSLVAVGGSVPSSGSQKAREHTVRVYAKWPLKPSMQDYGLAW